jgi:hypothetical protein
MKAFAAVPEGMEETTPLGVPPLFSADVVVFLIGLHLLCSGGALAEAATTWPRLSVVAFFFIHVDGPTCFLMGGGAIVNCFGDIFTMKSRGKVFFFNYEKLGRFLEIIFLASDRASAWSTEGGFKKRE